MEKDRPEYGKQYALTGATGTKAISNGNSWKESEVKKTDEARHNALEKKKEGKKHKHVYKEGKCLTCGKSSKKNYEELDEEDRDMDK